MAAQGPDRLAALETFLRRHHLDPEQVGRLARAAGVHQLVVTHLGPGTNDARALAAYRTTIGRAFAGPVTIANDLDGF